MMRNDWPRVDMTEVRGAVKVVLLIAVLTIVLLVVLNFLSPYQAEAASTIVPGPTSRLRGVWWDYSQGPTDPKTGTKGLWLYLTTAEMWPRLTEHLGAAFSQWGYQFGSGFVTVSTPGLPTQVMADTAYMMHRSLEPDPPVVGSACPSSGAVWGGVEGYFYAAPNAARTGFVWAKIPGASELTIGAALPNATIGVPYSQSLVASGGRAPFTWTITGGRLPTGLTLSSSGVISGTATEMGEFHVWVTVTDVTNVSTHATFTSAPMPGDGG